MAQEKGGGAEAIKNQTAFLCVCVFFNLVDIKLLHKIFRLLKKFILK